MKLLQHTVTLKGADILWAYCNLLVQYHCNTEPNNKQIFNYKYDYVMINSDFDKKNIYFGVVIPGYTGLLGWG